MRCLQCGKRLSLLKKLQDAEFCSEGHRLEFQQQHSDLALRRLIDSQRRMEWKAAHRGDASTRRAAGSSGPRLDRSDMDVPEAGFLGVALTNVGSKWHPLPPLGRLCWEIGSELPAAGRASAAPPPRSVLMRLSLQPARAAAVLRGRFHPRLRYVVRTPRVRLELAYGAPLSAGLLAVLQLLCRPSFALLPSPAAGWEPSALGFNAPRLCRVPLASLEILLPDLFNLPADVHEDEAQEAPPFAPMCGLDAGSVLPTLLGLRARFVAHCQLSVSAGWDRFYPDGLQPCAEAAPPRPYLLPLMMRLCPAGGLPQVPAGSLLWLEAGASFEPCLPPEHVSSAPALRLEFPDAHSLRVPTRLCLAGAPPYRPAGAPHFFEVAAACAPCLPPAPEQTGRMPKPADSRQMLALPDPHSLPGSPLALLAGTVCRVEPEQSWGPGLPPAPVGIMIVAALGAPARLLKLALPAAGVSFAMAASHSPAALPAVVTGSRNPVHDAAPPVCGALLQPGLAPALEPLPVAAYAAPPLRAFASVPAVEAAPPATPTACFHTLPPDPDPIPPAEAVETASNPINAKKTKVP